MVDFVERVPVAGRCGANRFWVAFHAKIELTIEWIATKSSIRIAGFAELISDYSREHSGLRLRRFATCLYVWLQILTLLVAGMQKSAAHNVDHSDVPLSRPVAMGRLHEPYLMRFGPEHGVSKNINDILIDNLGYVWVATSDGLARYDGSDFRHWRHEPGQGYSLPSNRVFALAVDRLNRLWVASENHLSFLGHDRRDFVHIRFDKTTARCHSDISVLGEGADGAMWVGTVDGALCRIDDALKPVEVALSDVNRRPVSTSLMIVLHATPSGDLWIGTNEGVLRLRNGITDRPLETELGRSRINSLTSEPDGSLLVGGNKGLFRIDLHGRVTNLSGVLPPRAENPIVVADGSSARWIGTRSGLFRREQLSQYMPGAIFDWFSGRTYSFASKMHTWGLDESLFSGGVYAMVADSDGGLWVVGLTEGLAYLPASWRRFIAVDQVNGERLERKGMVAIATDAGGDGWLLSSTALFHFSSNQPIPRQVATISEISAGSLYTIATCAERLLIGDDSGVIEFDTVRLQAKRLPLDFNKNMPFWPVRIACAENGDMIVSHQGGAIDVFSVEGRLLRSISPKQTFGFFANGNAEIAIALDGTQWYSNERALFRWNGRYYSRYELKHGDVASTFAFSDMSEVWVGRFGVLERYRLDGKRLILIERVGIAQGMPDAIIEGLLPAKNGNIWFVTGRGLGLYDRQQSRIRMFGSVDGLPGIDFYYGPPKMLGPNRAVALSIDGMVIFDPQMSLPTPKASRLTIEALSLRRDRGEIALDPARPVLMRAGDRDLRILPRLLSFVDKTSQLYRSRLHGEDEDWVIRRGDGERVFSSLPPGRYSLELQGANADGVWSPSVWLQIEVLPPWWRSPWAILGYALLASALLWWLAYLDQLKLKRRHSYQLARQKREWAEQASQAKSRFLADLGHELRTPMTGVLGMSELLLSGELAPRQHGQVQSIRRAGEHLLRLVDDALDLAKIEAGRLELEAVPFALTTLVDEVAALVSPLAARKGLRFAATRAPEVCETWIGDPLRLRQILLNLLGNAVKFTERGEVGLRIEGSAEPPGDAPERSAHAHASEQEAADSTAARGRGELRLIVHDTGPGMDAEQLRRVFARFEQAEGARTAARYGGTGLGLAISRELALAMGGEIEASSRPGQGTEFALRLSLPFGPAPTAEDSAAHAAALAAADWKVILLVEDDPTVAEVLSGLLQQQGHRVVHAAHGLAAMTEALLGRFDLALIDLDLPGLDGCALAGQLRASGFAAPMLAITARADTQAEPDALAAGFAAFLRKPIAGERLRAAILAAVRAAERDD